MNFSKKNSESQDEYLIRLGDYKQLTGELTWVEIGEMLFQATGIRHLPDSWGRRYRNIKDSLITEEQILEGSEDSDYVALRKERIALSDERAQISAIYKTLSREESLKEIALQVVEKIQDKKMLATTQNTPKIIGDNSAILLISDWHYGVEIDNPFNVFNPEVCKERVSQLRDKVFSICKDNKISNLFVLNLGDMIAGNIHLQLRLNSRLDVVSQTLEVSELLSEFLVDLSSKFTNVEYFSCVDNHSRIDPNKKESIQLETFARIIDEYIKLRVKDINNLTINKNDFLDDIIYFNIISNDNKVAPFYVAGVHGDKDKQDNVISKLNNFIGEKIDLVCSAHLHHFNADESTFTTRISNGSLMGTDSYATDLRLCSPASQTLLTLKNNELEGIYKIVLDK